MQTAAMLASMKRIRRIKIVGRCCICNKETTHHHFYCDNHYPKGKFAFKPKKK